MFELGGDLVEPVFVSAMKFSAHGVCKLLPT